MEFIEYRGVSFAYPLSEKKVLDNINIEIKESEFVLICGRSGCGKSTLLRHLKKSMIPYGSFEGSIRYRGREISELTARESAAVTGYVGQDPDNQLVTDKVWHELAFGLESLGMDNPVIKRRVAEIAAFFGIEAWFDKNVEELSGGQKQTVNLASVMAMQPEVLILDEPTSQLDPIATSEFIRMLHKINRELGTAIIIAEHKLEEIFPLADRVLLMDSGRVTGFDTPGNIGRLIAGDGSSPNRHPMHEGLPAVMKIYSELAGAGKIRTNLCGSRIPLTVREGRLWIGELLKGREIISRSQEEMKAVRGNDGSKGAWGEEVISLKNVCFRYEKRGRNILDGVNLSVRKGEIYCLLGGNGAGKSTALKVITGILKPQSGRVSLCTPEGKKPLLTMLPQNPQALFTEITAEEELLEGLRYAKMDDAGKVAAVEDMLKLMNLEELRKSNPYDLSGGEQQRLALGKVLMPSPEIILLDEPTKGIDPFFVREMGSILRKLKNMGVTILIVTHDVEFAAEYSDRCSMFFHGEIIAESSAEEFFPGNNFYTTAANRVLREYFPEVVTCREAAQCLMANL